MRSGAILPTSMRIEVLPRVPAELVAELGVTTPAYRLGELERHHVVQRRRGTDIAYVVALRTAGMPLGLLPVYQLSQPLDPSLDPGGLFTGGHARVGSRPCSAGGAGGYANHLLLRPALAEGERLAAVRAMFAAARELATGAGCTAILVPDLDPAQAEWLAEIAREATAVATREKAILPVEWDDFSGYLAALPRKRRWQVRQERRAMAESGIEVREESLEDVAIDLAPLLAQTQRRHGEVGDPDGAQFYLTMLAMTPGAETRALVGYSAGAPVAFSVVLRRGGMWAVRAFGRDYAVPDHSEYFNLTYYEPIARAAVAGGEAIDFGVGSLPAKRFRGCRLQPLRTLLLPAAAPPAGRAVAGFGDTTNPRPGP